MDEASTARPRRGLIAAAVVAGAVLVAIIVVALVAAGGESGVDTPPRGSAARAIARLDANHGDAYAGDFGDASDPATLRRTARTELRSDDARPAPRSDGRSRHCADLLRGSAADGRGRVVLLADATMAGAPAVVVGIADHGRVVVFVADATTCDVRTAQSL